MITTKTINFESIIDKSENDFPLGYYCLFCNRELISNSSDNMIWFMCRYNYRNCAGYLYRRSVENKHNFKLERITYVISNKLTASKYKDYYELSIFDGMTGDDVKERIAESSTEAFIEFVRKMDMLY